MELGQPYAAPARPELTLTEAGELLDAAGAVRLGTGGSGPRLFQGRPLTLRALVPAAIYLGLHTLEGQIVTPIVLGRRMALSPLVLILALMVFGWLWGLAGLLLAVPLLVCVKIVLTKVEGMDGWAKLLE